VLLVKTLTGDTTVSLFAPVMFAYGSLYNIENVVNHVYRHTYVHGRWDVFRRKLHSTLQCTA